MTSSVLSVRGLQRRFGGVLAVDDVSLDLAEGELHALIGPNGAGKTTLIHLLSGALRPSAGTVMLDGRDITGLAMHRRVRLGLARSYQITSVFPTPARTCSMIAVETREMTRTKSRTITRIAPWSSRRADRPRAVIRMPSLLWASWSSPRPPRWVPGWCHSWRCP